MTTPTGPEGFPEPGQRIGPYEIVRQLGMGGMGVVFEAVDTVLNRRVALKVISPYLADDPAFRVRFTQEAQAQASLDSPHVVQVFAHGEADGSLYIASQLIPDGDLGAMIRASGAPPPRDRARPDRPDLGRPRRRARGGPGAPRHQAGQRAAADPRPGGVGLPRGLRHRPAHRRRPEPQPDAVTTQGFAVGTPSYMAPELHTGGRPGTATDVYSLGCLLWAALVGPGAVRRHDRLPARLGPRVGTDPAARRHGPVRARGQPDPADRDGQARGRALPRGRRDARRPPPGAADLPGARLGPARHRPGAADAARPVRRRHRRRLRRRLPTPSPVPGRRRRRPTRRIPPRHTPVLGLSQRAADRPRAGAGAAGRDRGRRRGRGREQRRW